MAVAVVAAAAGAGIAVSLNHTSNPSSSAVSPFNGNGSQANPGGNANGNPNPFPSFGGGNGANGGSNAGGSGGANTGTGSLNASAIAAKVDPGIVDITSNLKYSHATAEGTGMVISSSGLVLTNNHVIDQATSVSATLVTSGKTYTAKVIGYDSTDDVALLQLVGASGLKTVTLSDSSKAKVGEAVLALGNAGGRGGLPSTAQGTIQALNQSIEASDSGAGTTEKLHGMIETNAPIQQGDSGGPLVNGSGAGRRHGHRGELLLLRVRRLLGGHDRVRDPDQHRHDDRRPDQVRQGVQQRAHRPGRVHGRQRRRRVDPERMPTGGDDFGGFNGFSSPVNSGALICLVYPDSPAASGGMASGDVITSVNGTAITSADGLTALTASSHPGDKFAIDYVDQFGTKHSTTITLTEWAK